MWGQELKGVMPWLLCPSGWQEVLGLRHTLGFHLLWREWEAVAGHGSVAQRFENCSHSFAGVWIQDKFNPSERELHLSLQCCEKVQPKLQPSSPRHFILLFTPIWLLRPVQHQHGWSKTSYLCQGSWLSTAQIEDQMQTFTLGSCHLKYMWWSQFCSKENESCLRFFFPPMSFT